MTAVNVKTNGYASTTPTNYLLDAGAMFKNITYDSVGGTYKGDPLGATVGGAKVKIKIGLRQPEVDGVLTPVKGNDVIESVEASIEGVLKEWGYANIASSLFADATTGDGTAAPADTKVIKGHNAIVTGDYATNIGYIGKIAGHADPVIIILKNAINTEGLEFDSKDKTEAGIPFKYEARAAADKPDDFSDCWQIIYPNAVV